MIDLNGMTILIGKEPGQGRLMVSTKINGQVRSAFIGNAGSVPDKELFERIHRSIVDKKLFLDPSFSREHVIKLGLINKK